MDERDLRTLYERGGLQLSAEELERLRPLAEEYLKRLDFLYSVELPETEEPAAIFTPEESPWPSEGEGVLDG